MGKGFDTFMSNPYWRKTYEEAPSDYLRDYFRVMFDISPFVDDPDQPDTTAEAETAESELADIWLSEEELEYLKMNAGSPQAKAFYQKCIDLVANGDEDHKYVCASCLKGEVRNPWFTLDD